MASEIARLPGISRVVVLADAHVKEKYTDLDYRIAVPSSTVVVGGVNPLYLQLRSRGIGCGMMAIRTHCQLPHDLRDSFGARMEGFSRTLSEAVIAWCGQVLGGPTRLSVSQFETLCLRGARAVAEEAALPSESTASMYRGGTFLPRDEASEFPRGAFAEAWLQRRGLVAQKLNVPLVGNHFLEALTVTDAGGRSSTGGDLPCGELILMYHGACHNLEAALEPSIVERFVREPEFVGVSVGTAEHNAALRAAWILCNLSAAMRLMLFLRLRELLEGFLRESVDKQARLEIISEAPHNSIALSGDHLVYRHNAVPLVEQGFTILSGRHDHPSYLVRSGEGAELTVGSVDHGVGAILDEVDPPPPTSACTLRLQHGLGIRSWPWVARTTHSVLSDAAVIRDCIGPYLEQKVISSYAQLTPFLTVKHDVSQSTAGGKAYRLVRRVFRSGLR